MSTYTPGLAAWKLAFQLSPIVLTNGIVADFPASMLPIIALTEMINFPLGLLTGGANISLDRFFANFQVVPGTSVIRQAIGEYPFANQAVAANAVISQPNDISYMMIAPAQERFGMFTKLAIMETLIAALTNHNASGGTYICVTPSKIYPNCVMTGMRDASTSLTKQPQHAWQLDFRKPLITLADAEQAQNGLFSILTSGAQVPGNPANVGWSGVGIGGAIPGTVQSPAVTSTAITSAGAQTVAASASPDRKSVV